MANEQVLFDLRNFDNGTNLIEAMLRGNHRVIVTGGGIRGGKTYNSLGGLILLHRMFPKSRSVIIRNTLDVLKRNTLPSCQKIIPSNFIQKFNGTDYVWNFKNGSSMFFLSENYDADKQLNRFNGLEINFALLEQMEEIQQATFEKTLERIGSYVMPKGFKQPPPLLIGTVNPTNTWVRKMIYDPYIAGTLPENWLYMPALLTGNPHIPESFKSSLLELKKANPQKYFQFVEGSWDITDKTGEEFYHKFNLETHTHNKLSDYYDPQIPLHISFDFNHLPYCTCIVFQVQGNSIYLIAELCVPPPEGTPRGVARAFAKKFNGQIAEVNVYGDYSGKSNNAAGEKYFDMVFEELRTAGFRINDKVFPQSGVKMRGEFINEIFAGNYDYKIEIDDACQNSIADLIQIKKNADGAKFKQKIKGIEKYGHCSDCLDYFLCELMKSEFMKFSKQGEGFSFVVPRQSNTRAY